MAAEKLITEHLELWTTAIKRRSAAGRGSSSKTELYGVKKLRELILELAVRGLLVPQDPKDEPAHELLKKIAAEKAKLVKAGKIKKEKPLAPIGEEETSFSLPSGWAWCRLDNVSLHSEAGWSPKCEEVPRIGSGWGVLKVSAVTWGAFNPEENKALPTNLDGVPGYEVKPGDFLISRANTAELVARSVVVQDDAPAKLMMSDKIIRFKFSQEVCVPYLSLFNNSSGARRYYLKVAGGTSSSMKNVSRLQIQSLVVPLPPLTEQHRIVAKVDELMALCDQLEQQTYASLSAHQILVDTLLNALASAADHSQFASAWQGIAEHFDTLFTTEESIDQLKQTILQLAVMGKLVPQDPNDEPASELLKKIAAEKAKLVKEGKVKKEKPLPPIAGSEKPYELPKGWEWVRSYQVAESRLGKMLDKAKNSGAAYPYLRNTNVQWQRFDLNDIKEINLEPHELDEYRLRDGDLLICEGGEPGRCAIWRAERSEMYFQKALHRVRTFGGVLPQHIAICLRVDAQCGRLDQFFTGATIKHFAGQELNRYFFALPPVAEQSRIVAKVDELMAICDQLASRLNDAQTTQLRLADAIAEKTLAGG